MVVRIMTKRKQLIIGTTYYVNSASGDDRYDGLDHGGWVERGEVLIRNIHALRTIGKAMEKITKYSRKNT